MKQTISFIHCITRKRWEICSNLTTWTSEDVLTSLRRLDVSPQDCTFIQKETLAQAFSCEFSKISKNTFFHRTPLVAASIRIFCHRTELNKIKKLKRNTRLYAHVTSPIHRTDKYSQHSSIVWPVWLNG